MVKPHAKSAKMIKSFQLFNPKFTHVKIPFVYNDLHKYKFIDEKTEFEQLENVFKNVTINKPIKWLGGDGDLKVLIHSLISKKIIIDPERSIWDITRICFIKAGGSLFKNSDIRGSKETKRASEIRFIISKILN